MRHPCAPCAAGRLVAGSGFVTSGILTWGHVHTPCHHGHHGGYCLPRGWMPIPYVGATGGDARGRGTPVAGAGGCGTGWVCVAVRGGGRAVTLPARPLRVHARHWIGPVRTAASATLRGDLAVLSAMVGDGSRVHVALHARARRRNSRGAGGGPPHAVPGGVRVCEHSPRGRGTPSGRLLSCGPVEGVCTEVVPSSVGGSAARAGE